jgi:hypothetical protein
MESDALWRSTGGGASVIVNDGTIRKSSAGTKTISDLTLQNNGVLEVQTGTLTFSGGSYTQNAGATRLAGGDIQTSGTLDIQGGLLEGSGTIQGNLTLGSACSLAVAVGGTLPGEYSQFNITGTASIDGSLQVTLLDAFVPAPGDTFDVLVANPRNGYFCSFTDPVIDGSVYWNPLYPVNEFALETVDTEPVLDCDGDLTADVCQLGACCFTPDTCGMVDQSTCAQADGVFRGPCHNCPNQNVTVIVEPGGEIFVHVIGPPVECLPADHVPDPPPECPPEDSLVDPWVSPEDGQMCHTFGVDGSPAIPADFFGPGSMPFSGDICLKGEPLGATQWGEFGEADTLILRAEDPFDRCDLPGPDENTVEIEIVALNLVSVAPITVNMGGELKLWDVAVDLSSVPAPPGTLTAIKTHCNGGTFTSLLHVQPRFTFTMVEDSAEVRVLDTGLEGIDPVTLLQDVPAPWVTEIDPDLGVNADRCSDFHGGLDPQVPTGECDCDGNGVNDVCDPDCNDDGLIDACDPNDEDGDGVPDVCDECPGLDDRICDDLNDCTIDSCINGGQCVNDSSEADGLPCDDEDACTESTTCTAGVCANGSPVVCDDGEWCNGLETCHNLDGCQPGTAPCSGLVCDEENDLCPTAPQLPTDPKHQALKHRYLSINPSTNAPSNLAIKVEVAETRRCQNAPTRACLIDTDCDNVCDDAAGDPPHHMLLCPPNDCSITDPPSTCIWTGPCVDMAPDPALAWVVQEPVQQADGEWTATLSDTVYSADWVTQTVLHIGDCPTVPCVTYHVYACDPMDIDICSEPLEIATQRFPVLARPIAYPLYGDVTGGMVQPGPEVLPPDGYVNVSDLQVTVLTIINYGGPNKPQAHPTWVDLHGLGTGIPPNYILNVADLQAVYVYALTKTLPWVNTQEGLDPQDCPGQLP